MADEQINSLERFRKQSDRLTLEEHSHCEIPAGCGGVVLRWRNPWAAVPLLLYLYAPVRARLFIDATISESSRLDLSPGIHTLAMFLENVDSTQGLLMFAAVHVPNEHRSGAQQGVVESPIRILSKGDDTWKYTLAKPPEDWNARDFDDSEWRTLTRVDTPQLSDSDDGIWSVRHCGEEGAECLGLPAEYIDSIGGGRRDVWIRKAFTLPAPVSATQQ